MVNYSNLILYIAYGNTHHNIGLTNNRMKGLLGKLFYSNVVRIKISTLCSSCLEIADT